MQTLITTLIAASAAVLMCACGGGNDPTQPDPGAAPADTCTFSFDGKPVPCTTSGPTQTNGTTCQPAGAPGPGVWTCAAPVAPGAGS